MARTVDILGIQLSLSGIDASEFRRVMADATQQAATAFQSTMTRTFTSMSDNLKRSMSPMTTALKDAADLQRKLEAATTDAERDLIKQKLEGLAKYGGQMQKLLAEQHKGELDRINGAFDRKLAAAKKYNEYAAQSFEDRFEQAATGIGDTLNNVVTLNLKDAFKKGGGFFAQMGAGLQAKGAATSAGGGDGSKMEMLGSALAKVGSALAVVAGMAAGIAALVKVIMDAEAQTREFNREIINSAGALDTMGRSGQDVTDGLDGLRKSAINATTAFNPLPGAVTSTVSSVMKLGVTSKEYLGVLYKFNEAGVLFDKMRGNTNDLAGATENYTTYVRAASTYSRLFGESMETMATSMSEYMLDFGMSLREVSSGFSTIADEAMKSGYGTKRFLNMVMQATTGMGMYNIRLDSTAKLLTKLARTLGITKAGDFLKEMSGKITGESYTDRTKRVLTTGAGLTGSIVGREAEGQAGVFKKAFEGMKLNTGSMTAGAAGLAGTLGSGSNKEIVKALASASEEDRGALVNELQRADPELARRLEGLIKVSQGTSGKMKDMVEAIGYLGAGSKMVLEMNKMREVMGKSFSQMNLQEKMAYQAQTGASTEMMDQMQRVQDAATRQIQEAERIQKAVKDGSMSDKEANALLLDSNLKIGDDGKLHSATSDAVIKDANDQMMNVAETTSKEQEKLIDQHIGIGEATNSAIYELNNIMAGSVVSILETISGYVADILEFLGIKEDKGALRTDIARKETEINQRKAALDKEIEAEQKKVQSLRDRLASGTLTDKQADVARAGLSAGTSLIAGKRGEKAALSDEMRGYKRLGAMATEDQVKLFNLFSDQKFADKDTGLRALSSLDPTEAAKKLKEVEEASGHGTLSRFWKENVTGTSEKDLPEALALKKISAENAKKTADATIKTSVDTAKNKKTLDESLKSLDTMVAQGEEAARKADTDALNTLLKRAGFKEDQLLTPGGDAKSITGALETLKTTNPDAYATFATYAKGGVGKKYDVKDAIITERGDVVQGAPGDITMLMDRAGLKTAGMGQPGGANLTINITATAGMEHAVKTQVLSALKQYYGVVTGSTRSVQ